MKNISDAIATNARALRDRLGPHVAPEGLYEQNKALPFAGSVRCNVTRIEAGAWSEVVLDYEVGASGIADGAWLKATFKFYSDWALFQTTDPKAANFISAEYQAAPLRPGQSPATVQALHVRFDQKGHERPCQKAVIVDISDGYLNAGDHIIIRLGDRRQGPGTRVQTFVEENFRFRMYVDPLGTSRFVQVPGDVVIDIHSGAPAEVLLKGPRFVSSARVDRFRDVDETAPRWAHRCASAAYMATADAKLDRRPFYSRCDLSIARNHLGRRMGDGPPLYPASESEPFLWILTTQRSRKGAHGVHCRQRTRERAKAVTRVAIRPNV